MVVNLMPGRLSEPVAHPRSTAHRGAGWAAALREFEHQALHWDTPEHGDTGHLIAQALRAAVDIARTGGLQCERACGAKQLNVATSDNGVTTGLRPPERRSSAA